MTRYLVVGDPVAHSRSPAMMNAAFRAAGMDARYDARRVPADAWPHAMGALHREGIAGCNVTVPLKEGALRAVVVATPAARAIGAVNTLIRRNDGWEGDNTDGPGFLDWVRALGAGELLRREALVLGAGGSARAVVWALREAGCPRVRVANRTARRARRLASSAGAGDGEETGPGRGGSVVAEEPGRAAPEGGLVVNCTSLGLRATDPSPIAAAALAAAGRYLDLVYGDPPGVRAAREAGVPAEGGVGMLVAQGALSFARWTGQAPDRCVMRDAAEREEDPAG